MVEICRQITYCEMLECLLNLLFGTKWSSLTAFKVVKTTAFYAPGDVHVVIMPVFSYRFRLWFNMRRTIWNRIANATL